MFETKRMKETAIDILRSIQRRIMEIPAIKDETESERVHPFNQDSWSYGISQAIIQSYKDRALLEEVSYIIDNLKHNKLLLIEYVAIENLEELKAYSKTIRKHLDNDISRNKM